MQFTAEQAAIISAGRGNLLVSAAAGSGKTAVLTERIARRIIDGKLDIREVLVMTFTEAAARQMKDRIEQNLRDAFAKAQDATERQRLNRQLSLLPGAMVSTIHAFCLDVIRNFYSYARDAQGMLLVEPGFLVEDGNTADQLLEQTLDEYLNGIYEAVDIAAGRVPDADAAARTQAGDLWPPERQAALVRLMDGYGGSRNDIAVRQQILALHRFLRSLPDYPAFVADQLANLASSAADFSGSRYEEAFLRMLALHLEHAREAVPEIETLLAQGARLASQASRDSAYRQQYRSICATVRRLDDYHRSGGRDWETIRQISESFANPDLPRANRHDAPEKSRIMQLFTQNMAELVHFLTGSCGTGKYRREFLFETRPVWTLPASAIEEDITAMLPVVRLLFDLVLGLDRTYTERKRAGALVDFSDFEHLALTILRQDEVQQYYRRRFQEIYVDEYQDTSSIQESIISAISDGNCLVVGDIKQSIYRFRHARPKIFLDKATAYRDGKTGVLHELNRNFRSVPGILQAVNLVFGQLMSPGAGEIDYDQSQVLVPDLAEDPANPLPVCILLVDRQAGPASGGSVEETGDDGGTAENQAITTDPESPDEEDSSSDEEALAEDLGRDHQEALAVIRQLRALHEQGYAWRDIALLARTRSIGTNYFEMLESCSIPAWLQAEESFLDSPVVRQIEALIHVLDNGRQDIPLASVMRSGLFHGGFSVAEMAQIRLAGRASGTGSGEYHESVRKYAASGADETLRGKAADFLTWLGELREREQVLRLSDLISQVFADSGWLDRLAAEPEGSLQIHRLRQFRQWAEQFERGRRRGLFAFARFLENVRQQRTPGLPADISAGNRDVVRILTIHGSKGLEFKIVFLVGTGYRLTPKESQDSVLISENLGIGMDFADPEMQIRYPSHLKLAMLEEVKASVMAEEMRLLYVAMTRAKEKLFIAGTIRLQPSAGDTRLGGLLRRAQEHDGPTLPAHLVLSARNSLEWILMALARQPGLDLSWLEGGASPCAIMEYRPWRIEVLPLRELIEQVAAIGTGDEEAEAAGEGPGEDTRTGVADGESKPKACAAGGAPTMEGRSVSFDELRKLVADPYRFADAAGIPAKVTVSELKRQGEIWADSLQDEDAAAASGSLQDLDKIFAPDETKLRGISLNLHDWPPGDHTGNGAPDSGEVNAARLGTILHAILRGLDLAVAYRQPESGEIERQLESMRQFGMLDQDEIAAAIPLVPRLVAFLRSDVAAEMVAALEDPHQPIYREMPFTLAVPASELYPDLAGLADGDQILIQGMIDCWYENGQGITLLDYKSDRLTDDPERCLAELKKRYSLQLSFYARAISAVSGKPVSRRLIWLIRQGRAYDLSV